MSALPVFRRFTVSDYPTAPEWASQMFNPLNLFCEGTIQSLNKGLVLGQNIQGQKFTTSFTTLSGYAAGDFTTISFAYTGSGQPDCLLIGNISKADGSTILLPVSITSWYLNINVSPYQLTVKYVAGLVANTKYNITFVTL